KAANLPAFSPKIRRARLTSQGAETSVLFQLPQQSLALRAHKPQARLEVQLKVSGNGQIALPIVELLHALAMLKKPVLALTDSRINSAKSALDVLPGRLGAAHHGHVPSNECGQALKLIGDLEHDVLSFRVGRFVGESARLVRTQAKTRVRVRPKTRVRVRHCVRTSSLSPSSRRRASVKPASWQFKSAVNPVWSHHKVNG